MFYFFTLIFAFFLSSCSTGIQRLGYDRNLGAYPEATYTQASNKAKANNKTNSNSKLTNKTSSPTQIASKNKNKSTPNNKSNKPKSNSKSNSNANKASLELPDFEPQTQNPDTSNEEIIEIISAQESSNTQNNSQDNSLEDIIKPWLGTPYLYGGNNKSGIDCSAFAQNVLKDYLGILVPRTTSEGYETGRSVSESELNPGDLVYFGNFWGVEHVGVYVGKRQFAHASTSAGVRYDDLDAPWWADKYKGARRY